MRPVLVLATCLCACASAPGPWSDDLAGELAAARQQGRDLVVFFALPGRELSERMERDALPDPAVAAALQRGGFRAVRADGFARAGLYREWIGSGEGMGIAVLDGAGRPAAARPGPQDAPELAAFLHLVADRRAALAAARGAQARAPGPETDLDLGTQLLELGCRLQAEPLLVSAAMAGLAEAPLRLALLHGQDGRLEAARRWLGLARPSPERQVVDGYVAFKERRHQDAVRILEAAVAADLPAAERQRGLLFLGKALHECGRPAEALAVLRALARDAAGSTFAGAALHAIAHIENPDHGHSH